MTFRHTSELDLYEIKHQIAIYTKIKSTVAKKSEPSKMSLGDLNSSR